MNPTPKHIAKLLTYLGTLPWQRFDKDDWMAFSGCETDEPCIIYGDPPIRCTDRTTLEELQYETDCDVVLIREIYDDHQDEDHEDRYGDVSYSIHFTTTERTTKRSLQPGGDNMGCVWLTVNFRTGKCDHGIELEDYGPEFIGWLERLAMPGFPKFEKEHKQFEADAPAQEWDCIELPAPLARA